MKGSDKDWIISFVIACGVSLLFYWVNFNTIYSSLDLFWLYFGIVLPFGLPIGIMIRNRLNIPEYVWGY